MMLRQISPLFARRLAVARQRLAGPRPRPDAGGIMDVVGDLGCLQLDPINAVARSHLLVLWSRLGAFDLAEFERVMWKERRLFEYWAHCASIVETRDYPLFNRMMRGYPAGNSPWAQNVRAWIEQNALLRRRILAELRRRGPLLSREFEEMGTATENWVSTGWAGGRNISRMLDYLWMQGRIMVAGRVGVQKLWDLSERCLPEWTPRERLSEQAIVRQAAERSLRALGVATARDIGRHFMRGRYPGLQATLAALENQGMIERVEIADQGKPWPGVWYLHAQDVAALEQLDRGEWQPRTTLLSPFDNLICDRQRTLRLFDFDYRIEIYTPQPKRRYGYYVLPILHGERLIGRLDPVMDRALGRLVVKAVHAEPRAPQNAETGRAVGRAVEELATFLGAQEIAYPRRVPAGWKRGLG